MYLKITRLTYQITLLRITNSNPQPSVLYLVNDFARFRFKTLRIPSDVRRRGIWSVKRLVA
jgi:hypothetical protein